MIKISDAIRYFDAIEPKNDIDDYYEDPKNAYIIVQTLSLMKEALGDIDLPEDYLKVFVYCIRTGLVDEPEREIEKVRILYELSKDMDMSREDLSLLMDLYEAGPYRLMFDEIKKILRSHQDLWMGLFIIKEEAHKYAREEARKLEYLYDEYSPVFAGIILNIVSRYCLSADKVLEIIPSKEFIDASMVRVPASSPISSGELFIVQRLGSIQYENDYQKLSPDSYISIGVCRHGDELFTSFTKAEYEDELKRKNKVLRKK